MADVPRRPSHILWLYRTLLCGGPRNDPDHVHAVTYHSVVGFALLWTLEREPGDAWTREVADAWTAVYGVLSGRMIEQAYGRRPEAVE